REWNDLDAAERLLSQGMELIAGALTVDADVVTRGYVALAALKQARGEYAGAYAVLDGFQAVAERRHCFPLCLARGAAARTRVHLLKGDIQAASAWADAHELDLDGELDYLDEAGVLTLVRVRTAQGRPSTVLPCLRGLLQEAEARGRVASVIEILI